MEEWRDIPGWEGLYQGSTEGRIKSVESIVDMVSKWGTPCKLYRKSRIIKGTHGKKRQYLHVTLSKNGKLTGVSVHTLIALAFPEICGEKLPGYEVSHLDEDPTNNKPENLRWVPHIDNINWGSRNIKAGLTQRNRNDCSKPVLQYTLDGTFVKEYPSQGETERQTGFARSNISACCRGIYKSAYGYVWKYKTLPN